jgi:hypothetical protein
VNAAAEAAAVRIAYKNAAWRLAHPATDLPAWAEIATPGLTDAIITRAHAAMASALIQALAQRDGPGILDLQLPADLIPGLETATALMTFRRPAGALTEAEHIDADVALILIACEAATTLYGDQAAAAAALNRTAALAIPQAWAWAGAMNGARRASAWAN